MIKGHILFANEGDRDQFLLQVQEVTGLEHSFKRGGGNLLFYSNIHTTQLNTIKTLATNYQAEVTQEPV